MNPNNISLKSLMIISIISILFFSSCRSFKGAASHGWEGTEYENTYLSVNSPLGSKAFKNWKDYDIDVRDFFENHKDPDVVYSKYLEVTFYYLEDKLQVKFIRPAVGFKTKSEITSIPEELHSQLIRRFY